MNGADGRRRTYHMKVIRMLIKFHCDPHENAGSIPHEHVDLDSRSTRSCTGRSLPVFSDPPSFVMIHPDRVSDNGFFVITYPRWLMTTLGCYNPPPKPNHLNINMWWIISIAILNRISQMVSDKLFAGSFRLWNFRTTSVLKPKLLQVTSLLIGKFI